jgi:hypothetical protein
MRNYIIIFLAFIGLVSLFSACEKDETKAILLTGPIAPAITTVPDLVLKRVEASKSLQIIGTKADFGFQSSVTYNLEADLAGNKFANPIVIASNRVDTFNISVTDLNNILIKTLPLDKTSAMELRIRAALTIEASGANPIVAISDVKAVSITTYGPPALSLTTAGTLQTVTSPTDNKKYVGWIYTDGTAFKFTNKDNGKIYGGNVASGTLTENGPAIALDAGGYNVTVDLTDLTQIKMTANDVTIGIIGDAVGGWDNDTKMIYNFTDHTWNITKTVTAGGIKFRTHGGWAGVNVAYNPAGHDLNNLYQNNGKVDSDNIGDIAPGKYNIKLYLDTTPMKVVFTPTI